MSHKRFKYIRKIDQRPFATLIRPFISQIWALKIHTLTIDSYFCRQSKEKSSDDLAIVS